MSQAPHDLNDGGVESEEEDERSAVEQAIDQQQEVHNAMQLAGELDERNLIGESNSKGIANVFAQPLISMGFSFDEVAFGCHYHVVCPERQMEIEDNNLGVSRARMAEVSAALEDLGA